MRDDDLFDESQTRNVYDDEFGDRIDALNGRSPARYRRSSPPTGDNTVAWVCGGIIVAGVLIIILLVSTRSSRFGWGGDFDDFDRPQVDFDRMRIQMDEMQRMQNLRNPEILLPPDARIEFPGGEIEEMRRVGPEGFPAPPPGFPPPPRDDGP